MNTIIMFFFVIILCPSLVFAGEIYGTIKKDRTPVEKGIKVEVKCAGRPDIFKTTETDEYGSYRIYIPAEGNCTLTLHHEQKPSIEIYSYKSSTRYNLLIEKDKLRMD